MATAAQITDRAKRYRAQGAVTGKKICVICRRKPKRIDVMHLDGNESHGEKENLAYGCRSCNAKLAAAFKSIGAGRPTNQYNPASGVPSFQQYAWAVSQQKHSGEHGEFGAIIHRTPKRYRTEYAKRILREAGRKRQEAHEDRWNPGGYLSIPRHILPEGVQAYQVSYDKGYAAGFRKGSLPAGSSKAFQDGFNDARRRAQNPGTGRWHVEGVGGLSAANSKLARDYGSRDTAFAAAQTLANASGLTVSVYSPSGAELHVEPEQKRGKRGNPVEQTTTDKEQAEFAAKDLRRRGHVAVKVIKRVKGEAFMSHGGYKPVYVITSRGQLTRNPAAASAEVYEEFHGHAPRETVTISKRVHVHEHLASAGTLRKLVVLGIDKRKHTIKDFGGALLAFNEDKNQLFVEGGDQSLNLDDYGIRSPHEMETLGKVQKIDYQADKTHLGKEGGRATYTHQFRTTNENGSHVTVSIARYPDLIYDVRNEQLLFSGGSYTIRAEGIDV